MDGQREIEHTHMAVADESHGVGLERRGEENLPWLGEEKRGNEMNWLQLRLGPLLDVGEEDAKRTP